MCAALYLYHFVLLVYLLGSFKENHFQMFFVWLLVHQITLCPPPNPLKKSSGLVFYAMCAYIYVLSQINSKNMNIFF